MPERASTHRFSVSRRFSVVLVNAVTVTLFLFSAVAISIDLSRIRLDVDAQLDVKLRLAVQSIAEPLWHLDQKTIDSLSTRCSWMSRSSSYGFSVIWKSCR